jgi:hypothetical protein
MGSCKKVQKRKPNVLDHAKFDSKDFQEPFIPHEKVSDLIFKSKCNAFSWLFQISLIITTLSGQGVV